MGVGIGGADRGQDRWGQTGVEIGGGQDRWGQTGVGIGGGRQRSG